MASLIERVYYIWDQFDLKKCVVNKNKEGLIRTTMWCGLEIVRTTLWCGLEIVRTTSWCGLDIVRTTA